MNSLFKKFLNQLLVFVFTFTFVNIDIAITKNEMKASFIPIVSTYATSPEKGSDTNESGILTSLGDSEYERYKSGITRDKDGIASKEQRLDLGGASMAGDMWALIGMLAMGLAAMSFIKMCKKFTTDIMIAAAGALAFIVGEVMYIKAFQDMKEKRLTVTLREDGQVENKQVQTLEEEKQSYQDVIKAAKTKIMIQTAAAAAFAAAAAYGTYTVIRQSATTKSCTTELMRLSAQYMSNPGTKALAASCQAAKSDIPVLTGAENTLGKSVLQSAKIKGLTGLIMGKVAGCPGAEPACGVMTKSRLKEMAICLPLNLAAQSPSKNEFNPIEYFANHFKIDQENLLLMTSQNTEVSEEIANEDPYDSILKSPVEDLLKPYHFVSFIDESNPLYNLNTNKVKKDQETDIDFYIRTREEGRFVSGEITSMSLNEYNELNLAFPKNSKYEFEYSEILKTAASKGMDLLIPQTNAFNMKLLGLVGTAALVVKGIFATNMVTMDLWLSTPGKRAIGFGAMAAVTLKTIMHTKSIKKKAEENIKKIDKVLEEMRKLGNLTATKISSGYQQLASPSIIPLNGNGPMEFSSTAMPCLVDGSKVGTCGSIKSGIDNETGFVGLPSGLSQTASLAGQMADGIVGKTTMSGETVDATAQLSAKQGAIAKILDDATNKLNKIRKANGQEAVDHKKLNDRFLAMVKKSINKGLKGTDPKDLVASFGGGYATEGSDADKKEAKEDVTGAKPVQQKAISLDGSKKSGLNFSFTDDTNLDDLDANSSLDDVMASNQNKANKLGANEESEDDIHKNTGASLFKIISVRYLKSGFKRLLNEK
jgi:hypothetical protein